MEHRLSVAGFTGFPSVKAHDSGPKPSSRRRSRVPSFLALTNLPTCAMISRFPAAQWGSRAGGVKSEGRTMPELAMGRAGSDRLDAIPRLPWAKSPATSLRTTFALPSERRRTVEASDSLRDAAT
ncbi:hypothetical protein MGU_02727 [Metarhizium guizhouense ARSEF 977]|uniref:Uncharacterized protein n=1 Tax=Metarhizium guizhouense (strain ARSEF 977) TaxID=1276136 RepID=A0A0B4HCZ6_METGA|nr:hypothetical protein MGU_02727 [Metarhizium guizhouense ARSEF 977]